MKRAGAIFLETLGGSAGLVLGLLLPVTAVWALEEIAHQVEQRRVGRPVAIEVQSGGSGGYHLAFLRPGEQSQLPPNCIRDICKSERVVVRRRPNV